MPVSVYAKVFFSTFPISSSTVARELDILTMIWQISLTRTRTSTRALEDISHESSAALEFKLSRVVQTTLHFPLTLVGRHIHRVNFKHFPSLGLQFPRPQASHSRLALQFPHPQTSHSRLRRPRYCHQANQQIAIVAELRMA
jgi:hypothetical protein